MLLDAERVIALLQLKPLKFEGGYFRQTYYSESSTAIYFLLTSVPPSFSVLHSLPHDEIWHFYTGDTVELLLLYPEGHGKVLELGNDLENGHRPQIVVPAKTWQGARVLSVGKWALLGTTMAPGFNTDEFNRGRRSELLIKYPDFKEKILDLTWEEENETG